MNNPGLTISCPLFFKEDQTINYFAIDYYLDSICKNKMISAIYSMAYNTRYRMLNDIEIYEVNKFIIKKCQKFDKRVFVGHPYSFNYESIKNYFQQISKLNPNGISMLYPERYYNIDDPIINFLSLPKQYGLNLVLHEMKLISGMDGNLIDWPKNLITKVFNEIDLVAIKEDSKNDEISEYILNLCNDTGVLFILAGGGKRRAMKFFEKGLNTWLNGSTMFLPKLIDKVYEGFVNQNKNFTDFYLREVEDIFFENIVKKYGWHISHKAALEYFGFGQRFERFPHATMSDESYNYSCKFFESIKSSVSNYDQS